MQNAWVSIAMLLLFAFPIGGGLGQIIARPDSITAWEGNTAVFTCVGPALTNDCLVINWYCNGQAVYDGDSLPPDPTVHVRVTVTTTQPSPGSPRECSSRLEFNVTANVNQTSLQCSIQSEGIPHLSMPPALVTVLPDPILHPDSITAWEDNKAVFTCVGLVLTNDCPDIVWYCNGQPVNDGDSLPPDPTVRVTETTDPPSQGKCSSRLEFNVTASLNQTSLVCSMQSGGNVRQSTSTLLIVLSNNTVDVTHTILPSPTPTSSASEDPSTPTSSASESPSTPTSSASESPSTPTSSEDPSTEEPTTTDEGMRPAGTCAVVALIAIAVTALLSLP